MTRDDLEDLWSEVTQTKTTKERRLGAVAIPGPSPTRGKEDENRFSPAEWPTLARTIHVTHQHCLECGSTAHSIDGLFLKQARGEATRFVAKTRFNSVEIDTLPLEVREFDRPIPHCYSCILAEQLIEKAMKCDLGHHQLEMKI